MTFNDYSHDSVDSRLLNLHLHSGLPDSAVFPEEEEQQAVFDDQQVKMNVDMHAHVIWIFRIFWNDSLFATEGGEESTIVKILI